MEARRVFCTIASIFTQFVVHVLNNYQIRCIGHCSSSAFWLWCQVTLKPSNRALSTQTIFTVASLHAPRTLSKCLMANTRITLKYWTRVEGTLITWETSTSVRLSLVPGMLISFTFAFTHQLSLSVRFSVFLTLNHFVFVFSLFLQRKLCVLHFSWVLFPLRLLFFLLDSQKAG